MSFLYEDGVDYIVSRAYERLVEHILGPVQPPRFFPTEWPFVLLLGQGLTNTEIATQLQISSTSVTTKLNRIYTRTRMNRQRLGILGAAMGCGLGEAVLPRFQASPQEEADHDLAEAEAEEAERAEKAERVAKEAQEAEEEPCET